MAATTYNAGKGGVGDIRDTDKLAAALNNPAPTSVNPTTLKINGTTVTKTAAEVNTSYFTLDIADLSAEAVYYMLMPYAGTITKIAAVVDGAISTADVTITAAIGATAITTGVVTLPTAASAAGTNASTVPTALNIVTAGQAINLTVTGGGSGGTPKGHVVVTLLHS